MTDAERALILYLAELTAYRLAEPARPKMTAREQRDKLAALVRMVRRDAGFTGTCADGDDGA